MLDGSRDNSLPASAEWAPFRYAIAPVLSRLHIRPRHAGVQRDGEYVVASGNTAAAIQVETSGMPWPVPSVLALLCSPWIRTPTLVRGTLEIRPHPLDILGTPEMRSSASRSIGPARNFGSHSPRCRCSRQDGAPLSERPADDAGSSASADVHRPARERAPTIREEDGLTRPGVVPLVQRPFLEFRYQPCCPVSMLNSRSAVRRTDSNRDRHTTRGARRGEPAQRLADLSRWIGSRRETVVRRAATGRRANRRRAPSGGAHPPTTDQPCAAPRGDPNSAAIVSQRLRRQLDVIDKAEVQRQPGPIGMVKQPARPSRRSDGRRRVRHATAPAPLGRRSRRAR